MCDFFFLSSYLYHWYQNLILMLIKLDDSRQLWSVKGHTFIYVLAQHHVSLVIITIHKNFFYTFASFFPALSRENTPLDTVD